MRILLFILLWVAFGAKAQSDSLRLIQEARKFQQELNEFYKKKKTSPLNPADLRKFKRHDFFTIDNGYVVTARVTLTPNAPFKPMAATGRVVNEYRSFAVIDFELEGKACQLTLYQSRTLQDNPAYHDHLFLPFTDLTSGNESYGGGRYLDVRIPEGDTMQVNFNLAYNPYCAYSDRYSCPRVPATNDLPVAVRAGVRFASKN